ncbi:MAG: hypothetical protein Q8P68_05555 [Candidatus Peregrinibacteria bacterium]|nr:hypothetical protein [Candidatus Peregrinibacteria bacterium]MDZ4245022.1 hypothetical protein [Candidatus Gracilibacteria bacterium]
MSNGVSWWSEKKGDDTYNIVAPSLNDAAGILQDPTLKDFPVVLHLRVGETRAGVLEELQSLGVAAEETRARLQIREIPFDPLKMDIQAMRYMVGVAKRTLLPIADGFEAVDGRKFIVKQRPDDKWRCEGFHGFPIDDLNSANRSLSDSFDKNRLFKPYDSREEALAVIVEAFTTFGWIVRDEKV